MKKDNVFYINQHLKPKTTKKDNEIVINNLKIVVEKPRFNGTDLSVDFDLKMIEYPAFIFKQMGSFRKRKTFLKCSDLSEHVLNSWEKFLLFFRLTNAQKLDQKYSSFYK